MDNSRSLLPVIDEYESMIETLSTQVEFYANEQEHLRKEITTLIKENRILAKTLNEILDTQSCTSKETEQKQLESEMVLNLKRQLTSTLQEKDIVVQLWQNALKNVDHLEDELRLFEGRTHGYLSKTEIVKIKQKYEKQINMLEEQLTELQSKIDNLSKVSAKNMKTKEVNLEKALDDQNKTRDKVKHLENDVKQLHVKIKEIIKMRDELQKTLDAKNDIIERLKIKDIEAKRKVTEAIQIVEAAFYEKDAALLRENKAKEEVLKISKTLSEIIDETSAKIKSEIGNVKQGYNMKLNQTITDMDKLKEQLTFKNTQLEQCNKEAKLLNDELQRVKTGNLGIEESSTSKLLILEKNLEGTFQKLLLSEKQNLKLHAEKDSIKADLEQMANFYKTDIKTREVEKNVLKHEVHTLQKRLKISNSNLIQVAGEIDLVKSKLRLVSTEMQDKLQIKDVMYQEKLSKTAEAIENKYKGMRDNLQAYLEHEIEINKQWRKETQEIVNKFEKEIKELKHANISLKRKLEISINEISRYKKNLYDICSGVVNIKSVYKNNINKT